MNSNLKCDLCKERLDFKYGECICSFCNKHWCTKCQSLQNSVFYSFCYYCKLVCCYHYKNPSCEDYELIQCTKKEDSFMSFCSHKQK